MKCKETLGINGYGASHTRLSCKNQSFDVSYFPVRLDMLAIENRGFYKFSESLKLEHRLKPNPKNWLQP